MTASIGFRLCLFITEDTTTATTFTADQDREGVSIGDWLYASVFSKIIDNTRSQAGLISVLIYETDQFENAVNEYEIYENLVKFLVYYPMSVAPFPKMV